MSGLELLAVDREHVVPHREVDPFLVGGPVPIDVRDAILAVRRLEFEAGVARAIDRWLWPSRRPGHAGVRRIQFADHLVREVVEEFHSQVLRVACQPEDVIDVHRSLGT